MSYIGNTPFTAAFLTDTFSGNGSTVAFTMTVAPANTSSIIVAITGVLQDPSTYSVSGTTLTFSAAPPSGTSNISVRYLGIPASGVTTTAYRTVTNTTATAGQTSFTIPSYTVGYVDVYRNGVYLPTSDYTATTGTTVVLTNAATVGDTITTISFYVSSVLNAIPATAGSVSTSYLVDGSVTTAKLANLTTLPTSGGNITLPAVTGTMLYKNASGIAQNSTQPAFQVNAGTSGNTSFSQNTMTTIPINNVVFDAGGNFNSSTYRFTAPVAGNYYFYAQIYLRNNTSANSFYFRKNNVDSSYYNFSCSNGADQTATISTVINLAVNDYMQISVYSNAASPVYYRGIQETFFSGFLIG